jgi:AAA family ATP:ADP antiporter
VSLADALVTGLYVVLAALIVAGVAAAHGNATASTWLHRLVKVERSEVSAMLISTLFFFCTLMSYSILRPIRDEMAVATGVADLPKLFLTTLTAMAVVTPMYGALVARIPVRRFVRVIYLFLALNLVAFYFAWRTGVAPIAVEWVFFGWLSVYALFGTSMFWSVMADTFSSAQARRIFGFIGVGGTIGFITGLSITGFFAKVLGRANLMLVSAALIFISWVLAQLVPKAAADKDTIAAEQKQAAVLGGGAWAGAVHVLTSPYLLGIAGFLFLFVFGSTVLYAAQTDIIGRFYTDRVVRTELLARMELATQLITAFGQMFLAARLMRAGLTLTLIAVPVVSIVGFAALGSTAWGVLPLLGTFVVFNVARRAINFMLTQPSRKVLFTVLSREDKYKTVGFLETFVYRAGDQASVWGYAWLASLGLLVTDIAWITVPISLAYLVLAIWLARREQEMAAARGAGA